MNKLNLKTLETKRDALQMEQQELLDAHAAITDEAESAKSFDLMSAKAAEIKKINEQIVSTKAINGSLVTVADGGSAAPAIDNTQSSVKTLGDTFVESAGYKGYAKGKQGINGSAFGSRKAINTLGSVTTTGMNNERRPGYIPVQSQDISDLRVANLFRRGDVGLSTFTYVKEVMPVNTAAAVAEGGLKPEVDFDFVEEVAKRGKIAARATVTDELFMDHPYMRDYVNTRLPDLVKAREDAELINAPGTGARILGMLNVLGIQVKTYDASGTAEADTRNFMEAIRKAITLVKLNGRADAEAILINPLDLEKIELLKDGNNNYIGGGPFYVSYTGVLYSVATKLWGKPVIATEAVAEGTAVVGAFTIAATILQSNGGEVIVESTNSNKDDFENNRQTIRAEEWLTPVWYRPSAICHVIAA